MSTGDAAVVISGAGCLLPGCNMPSEFWQRVVEKRCATVAYTSESLQSKLIGSFGHISKEQSALALESVPFKLRRYAIPSSQWGIKAARDALAAANIDPAAVNLERMGLFTAQGDYCYPSVPAFISGIRQGRDKGELNLPRLTQEFLHERGMDPFLSIKGLSNNSLAVASLTFGARGDCGAFVQDSSASIAALCSARLSLERGDCDFALVIFSGSYNEALTLVELYQSRRLVGDGQYCPFDQARAGGIAGEGAIALILETAAHARMRQAQPLAVIDGISSSVRAADNRQAYSLCVQKLMPDGQAELAMDSVDAIVARGLGGVEADQQEIAQLENLLATAPHIPVTCSSPITGLVPACPIEMLLALQMFEHQQVPAIANLSHPASTQVPWVYPQPQAKTINRVLSLGRCFNGFHFAVALSQPSNFK
jgi:3-oxoacyl-[acyl-carrier-protein] synthase II